MVPPENNGDPQAQVIVQAAAAAATSRATSRDKGKKSPRNTATNRLLHLGNDGDCDAFVAKNGGRAMLAMLAFPHRACLR